MIRSVLEYAAVNGYIKNSLGGINYSDIYDINKAKAISKTVHELGWIDDATDLRILIKFIENMPMKFVKMLIKWAFTWN